MLQEAKRGKYERTGFGSVAVRDCAYNPRFRHRGHEPQAAPEAAADDFRRSANVVFLNLRPARKKEV